MTDLEKKRRSAKGWATRSKNSLEKLMSSKDIPKSKLEEAISDMEKRLHALDMVQAEFELEIDEAEIDAEIESAGAFRDGIVEARRKAQDLLKEFSYLESSDGDDNANASNKQFARVEAKLPKLTLPEFSGSVLQWTSFWDQFLAIIDKSDLATINKFAYLKSLLKGEAAEVVEGLSLTAENYEIACDLLTERFGRRELIRFSHIQELLHLTPLSRNASVHDLRKLHNKLSSHVRSLENLGITGTEYGVFLTPMILSCLPPSIRMEWARVGEGKESDLEFLLDFMTTEIENRERCNTFKDLMKVEVKEAKPKHTVSSVTALNAVSSNVSLCGVCRMNHPTSKCPRLVNVGFDQRIDVCKSRGLCFKCLRKGHLAASCSYICRECKGGHHLLFCKKSMPVEKKNAQSAVGPVSSVTLATESRDRVLMQTALINVCCGRKVVPARVLFDSGADRTYVSSKFVKAVHPEYVASEPLSYGGFGSAKAGNVEMRQLFRLELVSHSQSFQIVATEIPVICAPIHCRDVGNLLQSFSHLQFADSYDHDGQVSVDILIGLDNYWRLVKPSAIAISESVVAQGSEFGWILSGVLNGSKRALSGHQLLCICDLSDSLIRQAWNIEEFPDSKLDNSRVLDDFCDNLKIKDGRYEVALPWKEGHPSQLADNFESAYIRLKSLIRKLDRDPQLKTCYDDVLHEMEVDQIVEEVPPHEHYSDGPVFYLPHRPVVKKSSSSTKVRPVFDASAKGPNDVSLNDCMETGPNLLPHLVDVLTRFRRWPIAIVSDIKKAFLQILVRKEDQDVHRFLWEKNGSLRIMRILRVPFGNRSSPFILNATIKSHLLKYDESSVVKELRENLYVDDWLSGANSELEAKQSVEMATEIMGQAKMLLTKWESNKSFVVDKDESSEYVKVLGLGWRSANDCFSFDGLEFDVDVRLTKRLVLSVIARTFDPLGLLNPYVVGLKIIFQRLWRIGVDWDDKIPDDLTEEVRTWLAGLASLRNWTLPRCYFDEPWIVSKHLELHAFSDASEKAFGSCVYLVYRNGSIVKSAIVMSKIKVAPLKKITLPRLELLGAVLAAQLLKSVREALQLPVDLKCYCWTDSMVVLNWILGDPFKWKPFVANRVAHIHELTNPMDWAHCPGDVNPADLLTRGISAKEFISSELWVKGPHTLFAHGSNTEFVSPVSLDVDSEVLVSTSAPEPPLIDVNRWGSLMKAIRVMGWISRILNGPTRPKTKELTFEELEQAKLKLIRLVQEQEFGEEIGCLKQRSFLSKSSPLYKLSPLLDDDGVLRVQGRLDNSELTYNEKHPIIIPKGHLAELVVRHQHQLLKHAGVAQMMSSLRCCYWIIGLRRLAKRIKATCVSCQKIDKQACDQPMAPLPGQRVNRADPFSVIGLDHAGPLYCVDKPGHKFYILLITCAVVRAVHLELVQSLGTDDCIAAIRRFIARRGMPRQIFSDNAKTFTAAKGQMLKKFGSSCPDWQFIAPRSPWWGGFWERLVRSVKSALKKSVGMKSLTEVELSTILVEIEACINSRPLTSLDSEPRSRVSPLTPAHFLIGRHSMYAPPIVGPQLKDGKSLVEQKMLRDLTVNKFWCIWLKSYLRNLPSARGSSKNDGLVEGDLVLIKDENCPRLTWPIGLVLKLIPGKDGIVRTCRLKFKGSEFIRPIQRLHKLELADS